MRRTKKKKIEGFFVLVLKRRCGQSFVIGENAEIIVKVLREEDGEIIIGIDAPKSVLVDRLEVYELRLKKLKALYEDILLNLPLASRSEFQKLFNETLVI